MKRYNPKQIEPKWQQIWQETNLYTADLNSSKPKYIGMSMFNYPSGVLHVGHAMNYTISDVKARFKRQQGFESYHPVGWDSFGLPAENKAIKDGISPQESMARIIPAYRDLYRAMGWSNDWEKEIATHQPEYYKWTQWIFSEMYRAGLAYQEGRMQWWCQACQTVLANEQVLDGKCWRHDNPGDPLVDKKEVKQWFFKITDYADELLAATNDLDWTESVKLAQKNWIGKSIGAEVDFTICTCRAEDCDCHSKMSEESNSCACRLHKLDSESVSEKNKTPAITTFTTRIDTIFSAAFIVLAPEHKLSLNIPSPDKITEVQAYIKQSSLRTEVERQSDKEKTGVFTGAFAHNPANDERIPIWVGDFVLGGYGTGAVFGDIHDERDFEFLNKFNIPAKVTVLPEDDVEVKRILAKEYPFTGEGILVNSGEFNGLQSSEAREKITTWLVEKSAARKKVNYKMRDWSVSRQRYWGAPIPIIHCKKCGPVLVPDEDLPVILPELEDFQPSGDGRSALARATDWLKVSCPTCGFMEAERETDTLDTYICSSWYMLRYFDPHNQETAFDSEIVNKWMPIDFYNGGDHATAHMLYARFITRFFHKCGLLNNPEPFKNFLYNGKVRAADGSVMSKSKGTGVDPLEVINSGYGADALRMYLMFAAPLELNTRWDAGGVPGAYRFLTRLWNIVQEFTAAARVDQFGQPNQPGQVSPVEISDPTQKELARATHSMIQKVTQDIEASHYNTAIASLMACLNSFYDLKKDSFSRSGAWQSALEALVACSAPFAPHITEELWQDLGHSSSIHKDSWPKLETSYLRQAQMMIVIQVNGKLRATVELAVGATEAEVVAAARVLPRVVSYLTTEPKKIIYIEAKVLNFVI